MNTTMHMPARDGYRFEQGVTVFLSKTRTRRRRDAPSSRNASRCLRDDRMDLQLHDKTALVTGASMGIGRAIAKG